MSMSQLYNKIFKYDIIIKVQDTLVEQSATPSEQSATHTDIILIENECHLLHF